MHWNEPLSVTAFTNVVSLHRRGMLPRQTDVSSWFQRYLRQMLPGTFKEDELQTFGLNTLLGSNICPRFVNVEKKKSNIYSILWLGNVDSLVMWVESLDGSQEWMAAPWRTGTMFLMCHLLSECNWRQLSTGNSWSERPEACSSLTPRPWRGASCLHVPLAPFQRHIRPPRLFSGLVPDLSLFRCQHTSLHFKKKKKYVWQDELKVQQKLP